MELQHQQLYSDSDRREYITKAAIEHLARKAGVRRISGTVYPYARELMVLFLEDILKRAYLYNEFRRLTKLDSKSIMLALRSSKYKIKLVAGVGGNVRGNILQMTGGGDVDSMVKTIKKHQKTSKFFIPKQSFEDLCRNIASRYLGKETSDIQFKKKHDDSLSTLHYALQSYIIKILDGAQLQAIHAKRITIDAEDLKMANSC